MVWLQEPSVANPEFCNIGVWGKAPKQGFHPFTPFQNFCFAVLGNTAGGKLSLAEGRLSRDLGFGPGTVAMILPQIAL